jgi:hypothetical protein
MMSVRVSIASGDFCRASSWMSPRTRGLPPDDLLDFTVELEWRLVIEGHGLAAILSDVERVDPEPGSDRGGDFALSDLLAATFMVTFHLLHSLEWRVAGPSPTNWVVRLRLRAAEDTSPFSTGP